MFLVPGRFGGPGNGPTVFAPPLAPAVSRPPQGSQLFFPASAGLQPGTQPGSVIADRWGAISVPAQPQPVIPPFQPALFPGDPALAYVLSFLYAFLVTDSNANVPWSASFGLPIIKSPLSLWAHNPSDHVFQVDYLPSLYLFRDDAAGGSFEREADDWFVETSTWTMLWAWPLGGQDQKRRRSTYANQFVKSVAVGLERGVTPSWVLPGDPDPAAVNRGSFLGYWTNVMRMHLQKWRLTQIRIPMRNASDKEARSYPCVELKFQVRERLQPDLRRFQPLGWLDLQILKSPTGPLIEEAFDT